MLKKMSILLVAVLLMVMVSMPVFAETDIKSTVDTAMNTAISIAQTIGIAVAVILLIVVAIKYMAAAPSDKAEIKKHMVVYVVGAVLLLCASGVLQLIKSLGNTIIGDSSKLPTIDGITVETKKDNDKKDDNGNG